MKERGRTEGRKRSKSGHVEPQKSSSKADVPKKYHISVSRDYGVVTSVEPVHVDELSDLRKWLRKNKANWCALTFNVFFDDDLRFEKLWFPTSELTDADFQWLITTDSCMVKSLMVT